MSIEHHHLPHVTSDDVFNADVDYLTDVEHDPDLIGSIQQLQRRNPILFQRLLRHADSEAADAAQSAQLLRFGMFTLAIIDHALGHSDTESAPTQPDTPA